MSDSVLRHRSADPSWGRRVAAGLILLVTLLGPFLHGGTGHQSQGLLIALGGVAMLFSPWTTWRKHPKKIVALFLLLPVTALLAFLPAAWFDPQPWRVIAQEDFGIVLPSSVSPQPWLTMHGWFLLLGGLLWLAYLTTRQWTRREIKWMSLGLMIGLTGFAVMCAMMTLTETTWPWSVHESQYGPFPNRNQAAIVLAMGAMITLSQVAAQRGTWRRRAVGFLCLACHLVALIAVASRAGIFLTALGGLIFGAVQVSQSRRWKMLGFSATGFLLIGAFLFIHDGALAERLLDEEKGQGLASAYRWDCYADAWRLMGTMPTVGFGLGNFEDVFAVNQFASLTSHRPIHPESDWFWLGLELGWPGLVVAMLLAIGLLARAKPLEVAASSPSNTDDRRLGAFVAVILFFLHGFFDVSGHRLGSFFVAAFLLGLAFAPTQRRISVRKKSVANDEGSTSHGWHPKVHGSLAIMMIVIGWIVRYDLLDVSRTINLAKASMPQLTERLERRPLNWQTYFHRARLEAQGRGRMDAMRKDFLRARYLEQGAPSVPWQESLIWMAVAPRLAPTAWAEVLRRDPNNREGRFAAMLRLVGEESDLWWDLFYLASEESELHNRLFAAVPASLWQPFLDEILSRDPKLLRWPDAQKAKLFQTWYRRGNVDHWVPLIESNSSWKRAGWLLLAKHYASQSDYAQACELSFKHMALPDLFDDDERVKLQELRLQYARNRGSLMAGLKLAYAEIDQGNDREAQSVIRGLEINHKEVPQLGYLKARLHALRGDMKSAWSALEGSSGRGPVYLSNRSFEE